MGNTKFIIIPSGVARIIWWNQPQEDIMADRISFKRYLLFGSSLAQKPLNRFSLLYCQMIEGN